MAAKVHVAGPAGPGGEQPCSRCGGAIIEEARGNVVTGPASGSAPRSFEEGSEIVVVTGASFRFCTARDGYEGVAEVCAPTVSR